MKHTATTKNRYILLGAALLLIISAIGIYILLRSSNSSDISPTNKIKLNDQQILEQNEILEFNTVDTITKEYITKTYPQATDISFQHEFIGAGFGVINTTYKINNIENSKKIYLMYINPKWEVFYENTDQITCEKVRELISTDTVLMSMCAE